MESPQNPGFLFPEFPPNTRAEWEAQIQVDLKGADYEKKLIWKSDEGIDINPYYCAEDLAKLSHMEAFAGSFPYVRGNNAAGNEWEIRQDIYTDLPGEANQFAVEAIRQGADGIGFHIARTREREDMEILLDNISLEKTAVHFLNARHYPTLIDLFVKYLDVHGLEHQKVKGSLNYDPISYALIHGDFYRGKDKDLDEAPGMIRLARKEIPGFRIINVNAQHFHHAGATVVQEIAYALAAGNEYLAEISERGLSVDEIAPHLQFTLAIGSSYFLEIAKLRAIRMLWSRIVEQYGPSSAESCKMQIHSTTSQWNKTLYDPYVNLLRTTTEIMSAALGGSAIISAGPFDQAFKAADEFSYHIARNQQILLKEESLLDKVSDPSAGSYYIEMLTDQLAEKAWALFREIEEKGGMIQCIEQNIIQHSLREMLTRKSEEVATRKLIFLGTNQYPNMSETMLNMISKPAKKESEVKKTAFEPLQFSRATEGFEKLRLQTERHISEGGKRPTVFLFNYGNQAFQKARATFATNFFACAGYEIIDNAGFISLEEGIAACTRQNASIIVFCSSDEEYRDILPQTCAELRKQCPNSILVVAGYPKELLDTFAKEGVHDFIHVRNNLLLSLADFNHRLGIN